MSIMPPGSESKPPLLTTHAICACQAKASPRIAFCGVDIAAEDYAYTWRDMVCAVCNDFIASMTPCQRCGL